MRVHVSNFASTVILAFSALETGQPALGRFAAAAKASWVAPGTLADTVRMNRGDGEPANLRPCPAAGARSS
jgi:hypothetical protein